MLSNNLFDNVVLKERIMIGQQSKIFIGQKGAPANSENEGRYVIKQLKCAWSHSFQGMTKDVLTEISCLITLRDYPQFVSLLSIQFLNRAVNLLFPEAICNLSSYITKLPFCERMKEMNNITLTFLSALTVMYNNSIFHADLKPDNVLVYLNKDQFEFKICDFGLSKYNNSGSTKIKYEYITYTYRPPELLIELFDKTNTDDIAYKMKGRKCNLYRCDAWSIGIILLQMYIGHTVLFRLNPKELYNYIKFSCKNGSINVREIISEILKADQMRQVKEEKLLLLEELLKISPKERWRPLGYFSPRRDLNKVIIESCSNISPYSPISFGRYEQYAQTEIFSICELACHEITVALTALDVLTRYLSKSIRNIRGEEYNSIQIDPFDIIACLKIASEIHYGLYDSLFEAISLYSKYYLMITNNFSEESDINNQNSNYPIESILSSEKRILTTIDHQVLPPYLINLISIFSLMKYDYNISNIKLNNLYMIS